MQAAPTGVGDRDDRRRFIAEQHWQTICGHHRADGCARPGKRTIGGRKPQLGSPGVNYRGAVHLIQPVRRRRQLARELPAIGRHRQRIVTNMSTKVETCIGSDAHPAPTRRDQAPHASGCRPLGNDPVLVEQRITGHVA